VRAIALEAFGAPLALKEVPVPEPGEGEVLVRVLASGVCGTDVKLWRGDIPGTPLPLVLGHETAGVVEAAGSGAEGLAAGTQVVVFHHLYCGRCPRCRGGRENLCDLQPGRVGFDRAGGWADYLAVPVRNVVAVPDGVPPAIACVVPDAVATVWRALVTLGEVAAGEGVAIVGAGGLGLSACQVARERGAEVLAVDVSEEKLARAREAGARHVALPTAAVEAARALPGGAASLVLDCAGTSEAIALAASLLERGSRLVQVGYATGARVELAAADVALKELRVLGCRATTLHDLSAALDAVGRGAVTPVVGHVWPLERAQDALDALREGEAVGRQVLAVAPDRDGPAA
jgi:2-desacetyl-2-hydroxyethyl bacteriochlorophyllide A dehydrogenase